MDSVTHLIYTKRKSPFHVIPVDYLNKLRTGMYTFARHASITLM